jgi:hypothetical protein
MYVSMVMQRPREIEKMRAIELFAIVCQNVLNFSAFSSGEVSRINYLEVAYS